MSGPEDRQAKSLEAIAGYMKQLVPIFATINQNLVDFAKMAQAAKTEIKKEGE